jgi:hypothetical protein
MRRGAKGDADDGTRMTTKTQHFWCSSKSSYILQPRQFPMHLMLLRLTTQHPTTRCPQKFHTIYNTSNCNHPHNIPTLSCHQRGDNTSKWRKFIIK